MSNRLIKKSLFYLLLGLLFLFSPAGAVAHAGAVAQESLLDGRAYIGQSEENHKKGVTSDELSFVNGKFHSLGFDRKGFVEGGYTAIAVEGEIFFEAITMSPKQGNINWSGVVVGDTIRVDYRWLKRGWFSDTEKVYSFNGTLKK